MRDKIHIRAACPGEGLVIQRILQDWGHAAYEWIDWSHAHPYWLMGDVAGVVKGAVMVNPGIPFGRVDMLTVDPSLPHAIKARLCRDLAYAGVYACQQHGSQAVFSNIDAHDTSWQTIAQHRGWVPTGTGSYFLKRCV